MSGGPRLTQHDPEPALAFDIGRETAAYRDREGCLRKILRLLDDPAEADRIRNAGREREPGNHTRKKRFGRTFRLYRLLEAR